MPVALCHAAACCVQSFSAGCRVLNLFGYTGGFSVYAGLAGAAAVTTVDVADAALAAADANWALNGLKSSKHEAVTMDAFEFLERAHAGAAFSQHVQFAPPAACPNIPCGHYAHSPNDDHAFAVYTFETPECADKITGTSRLCSCYYYTTTQ